MQGHNADMDRRSSSRSEDRETRAIELASEALGRLNAHQIECRDRYIALDGKIDRLTGILAKAGGALILLLLGAVGTLVLNLLNHGVH